MNLEISTDELLWQWLRFGWSYRGISRRTQADQDWYLERIKHEMSLIIDKQLADFFLFTSDALRWGKDNGVSFGPGRGSTAASVVAWLLRITEVDPHKYPQMMFERFLDPNREDPPDIDIDCSDEERWRVRDYLASKYGPECVGQIANFIRYRGKNSLVDVARVYNVPKYAKEQVSKLIIERSGGDSRFDSTLEDTIEMFPDAKAVFLEFPDLWKATRLEGNVRGMSVHAAGLVVSGSPLTDICAIYEKNGVRVMSFDKYDAEYVDALKLDFLGLATMGMISRCLRLAGLTLDDLYAIPDDDQETIDVFRRGDVTGVFQFEGRATRLVNRDVCPDHFLHITAVNALSRPGPLFSGTTSEFVGVRHGRHKPERYHPIVDDITRDTYGQIIYQEQILKILQVIGGFGWAHLADIRRIIAKKAGEAAFNVNAERFTEGALILHGIDAETADRIWKRCVTSGTYAFCCTGETVLEKGGSRQDSSPFTTVKELHDAYYSKTPLGDKLRYGHNGKRISLLSMDDDGRVRPSQFIKIHHPRPRQIMKMITDTGRVLRCSREHLVMTPDGYVRAEHLKAGSEIIAGLPKETPVRTGPNQPATGKHWNIQEDGDRHGEANPRWIDGRTGLLQEAQAKTRVRSKGKCEHCGDKGDGSSHALEFAHIFSLEFFKGVYAKYHSSDNLLHLCNGCHKKFDYQKGERVKRWTRGRPTGTERIAGITDDGVDLVYEISMEGPSHNYLANGIVSHNNIAHAISYSLLAFWCVSGGTRIYDWDNNEYVSVSKAFKNGISKIACYDEVTGKTVPGIVKAIIRTTGAKNIGLKECIRIRTSSAKNLICTPEHLVLTPGGYVRAGDLRPGSLVAAEKRYSPMSDTPDVRESARQGILQTWASYSPDEKQARIDALNNQTSEFRPEYNSESWRRMSPEHRARKVLPWIEAAAAYWDRLDVGPCGEKTHSPFETELCVWLCGNGISHEHQVPFGGGVADFMIKGVLVEMTNGLWPVDWDSRFNDGETFQVVTPLNFRDALHWVLEEEHMRDGDEVVWDEVSWVKQDRPRVTYDIVMENDPHNFIANGIVVHNCAWLKCHYPLEFYAASLAKAADDEAQFRLMKDAMNHGINVSPPLLHSSGPNWQPVPDVGLVAGWQQIPGIGAKMGDRIHSHYGERRPVCWDDLQHISGIGPKTVERIRAFAEGEDPFGLLVTGRVLARAREFIQYQPSIPKPTHNGYELSQIVVEEEFGNFARKVAGSGGKRTLGKKGQRVVYVGRVKARNYQDKIENIRSRTGEEAEDILKSLKRPDLLKYCALICFDETDEEVFLRINRFTFPKLRRALESIRVGHDVVVAEGNRIAGFGTPVMIDRLFVVDPD